MNAAIIALVGIQAIVLTPTAWCGILAFGSAGAILLAASIRLGQRVHLVCGLIYMILLVDVLFNFRHQLHGWVNAWMKTNQTYADRQPRQLVILAIILLGVCGSIAILRRVHPMDRLTWLIVAMTLGVSALFLLELVSLHAIDALLYRRVGPVLVIGVLWIFCALVTITATARLLKK